MELAGQELRAGAWEEGDECGGLQSSSDSDSEIPANYKGRRVSFADAFGLNLVSVKEFSCRVATAVPSDEAPDPNGPEPEEYFLCSQFTVPASASELLEKLEAQKCELESVELLHGTTTLRGIIRVLNLCYKKAVCVHTTLDGWATHFDLPAHFVPGSSDGRTDRFAFSLELEPPFPPDGVRVEFCLRYETPLGNFWANNSGVNYVLMCHQRGGREGKGRPCDDANLGNKKSCLKQNSKEKPSETNAPVIFTEIVDAPLAHQEVNVHPKSENPEEDGSQDERSLVETGRHLSKKTRQRLARLAQIRDRFRHVSTGPQRDDVSAEDGMDSDGQTDEDLDERWMPSAMPRVMWDWSQRSLIQIQDKTEAETEELFTFAGKTPDNDDADGLTDTAADTSEISTLDGGYVVWDWSKGSWTHTQAETDWPLPQAEIKLPLADAITGSDCSNTEGHSDTETESEISMPEEGHVVWDWSQRGRARIVEESPVLSDQAETEGQGEAEVYARLSPSGIPTLEESSVIWDWSYRNKGHMPSDPPQQSIQAQLETEEPFRPLSHTTDSETVPDGSHESSQGVRDPSTETGNWLDTDKFVCEEIGLGDLEGAVGGVGIWDMDTPCGAFWDAGAPQAAPSESVATRSKISSGQERCGSPQDRDEVPNTWERDVTDFSASERDYLAGDFIDKRGGDQRLRGAGEETFCEGQDRGLLWSHGERGGSEFKFETFVAPLYLQAFSDSRPNSQDISEGQWAGDQTSDDSDDEDKLSSTDGIGCSTAVAKSQPLFPVGTYHAPVHQPGGLGEISKFGPPNLQSRHPHAPKHGRGHSSPPVLETSEPAAGITTHGGFHLAADDRAEIISDSSVAHTTESGRPDEEHRELLFSTETMKDSQISQEVETKTGAEAVRATPATSNVNTRHALSTQDNSTISLFPLLAHDETKNNQGGVHGDRIASIPGLGKEGVNTEVEEEVFGEEKTRQEGVTRTNEEYCVKIHKRFMERDKGVTDFSDGHVEGMRMEKEAIPDEDHTASAVKKEEMNESEVSVETGNIQEESLIPSEDLHEEVSREHAEHAKEMSIEHKDIDNDEMLVEDEQLNKNISVGDKGLYGTNTNENLEFETSMERSELVDVPVVGKDSDNNEAFEEAEEIDDDDLLMEDEDNDNNEVLLEDECIDNHQVPADHEDTHDDEISVEDEDVYFDNVDTEEGFVEDDDIDDDKVSVEEEETDDDGDYDDDFLKEYEGIDDDEADYDDADEESVDEESDRCVSVGDEEIEGDTLVENEELHGGSLEESEDLNLRDKVGLVKDVSEEDEDVDYGEVSVEEKTHKYSSVAGKEVVRNKSVEKKHLDGQHLTGNGSVIDSKMSAKGKYLACKELNKDEDEEALSLEYGDSIDESVGKVPAKIDEEKSEMSTGKTAAIYDQQEVFLTGWKYERHGRGIEIRKEREDLEEGVGVACQGQESETFEDLKADTPGAVDVCLHMNRAEHGGKTENEGKEVWEACQDEGQQSSDVDGRPCGKNPDGDVENDSASTDSLTDDEMELHMRSVKLAHAQQLGRASLSHSGSMPISGRKRSSTSRSRLQLTTLSSISESLDEDGNTMEESSCASKEKTGKHEAVTLPPVAGVETASEVYPSSWKESFWSSRLCRGFFFSILCALFFITAYYYDFLACFALYLFSVIWLLCHGEKQRLQEANRGELGLASRSVTIGPPTGE